MNWLRRFHRNTGGAISVLVLLTIWCLIALVAMVWNTGEYAMHARVLQNAADSDAHAAATWMARTTNQITMQNMVIAQNGATDVIARSLLPTYQGTKNQITAELNNLDDELVQIHKLQSQYPQLLANIKKQYSSVSTSLDQIDADVQNGTLTFPNDKEAAAYANKLRQARYSVNWIENNYITQLQALVVPLSNTKITQAMKDLEKNVYAPLEKEKMDEFWDQVGSYSDIQGALSQNETDIFQEEGTEADETTVIGALPKTVENQRLSLVDFYKANIVHTEVSAPVKPAGEVSNWDHTDNIRLAHPKWFPPGLSPTVTIDPINPNTSPNPKDPYDPNSSEVVYPEPDPIIIDGEQVAINWNVPGGWGHCWAFPIERYFSDRVSKDMLGLQQQFFQNGNDGVDDIRVQLAVAWNEMAGINMNAIQAPPLPSTVTDDQLNPDTKKNDLIPVFPSLSNSGGTGTNTDADFSYRTAIGQYKSAIQLLISRIDTFGGFLKADTAPIAVPTWQANIHISYLAVSQEIGQGKGFMVLKSYKLQPIPGWAQAGMEESLTTAITWEIYQRNFIRLSPFGLNALGAINPYAREIARELVSRRWPYEITTPGDDEPVPPTRGMGMQDRHDFFNVLSVASETDATGVRVLLPTIFGNNPTKLAAYAQGEVFNWMEYNDAYGGYATEKFDEVSTNVFSTMLACPRAWRLSTIGGWNWQPRLSVADNLANAALGDPQGVTQANTDIQDDLTAAGISNIDRSTIDRINLH